MLKEMISEACILTHVTVADWQEAVRVAGNLLVNAGCVEPLYVDRMVGSIVENGPYVVIEKGFALVHARPDDGVKKMGVSLLTLAPEVEFGCEDNDPVGIVIGLSALNSSSHLDLCMDIAALVEDDEKMSSLSACATVKDAYDLLRQ